MARRKTHPGAIRKRGKSWQIRVTAHGHEATETLRGGTKKDAERVAQELHEELIRRAVRVQRGGAVRVRFSDGLARYRSEEIEKLRSPGSRRSYEASLRTLEVYFVDLRHDMSLDRLEPQDVEAFVEWRRNHTATGEPRETPTSTHTPLKDFRVLRRLLSKAEQWRWIRGNPAKLADLSAPAAREYQILSSEQYEALLSAAEEVDPMLGFWALVLGETGCRVNEALHLRWEDFRGGFMHIDSRTHGRRTKSNRSRAVPVSPRLARALTRHSTTYRDRSYGEPPSPSAWVFHHVTGGRGIAPGSRIRGFREPWDEARKSAKTPAGFRAHDLRHGRATAWLRQGHSISLVAKALGHSTTQVTEIYQHLVPDDLTVLVQGAVKEDAPDLEAAVREALQKVLEDKSADELGEALRKLGAG